MKKVRDLAPFGLRLPDDMREWIKERSKQNKRTMTTEILFILEKEKALSAPTRRASDTSATQPSI